MKKFGLATQIFVALVLGIVVGAVFYGNKTAISYITPIGDIFIHLIKMIVVPIVISALIVAVAGVGDMKKLGKLGEDHSLFRNYYDDCYFNGITCGKYIPAGYWR